MMKLAKSKLSRKRKKALKKHFASLEVVNMFIRGGLALGVPIPIDLFKLSQEELAAKAKLLEAKIEYSGY